MSSAHRDKGSTSEAAAGVEHTKSNARAKRSGPPRFKLLKRPQARACKCNECGSQIERSQACKCKGCKTLLCSSCALQCRSCQRHFCTLTCAGWEIEMPTIEQQKQQDVPEPVTALHSSGGSLGCKRCARRLRREGPCETPEFSPKRRRTVYDTPI